MELDQKPLAYFFLKFVINTILLTISRLGNKKYIPNFFTKNLWFQQEKLETILKNNTVDTLCSQFIMFGKIFFGKERTKKLTGLRKKSGFSFVRLSDKLRR